MCLLAIAWQVHPDYPLVVSANRDEFLARASQQAHFWPDYPHIFGGRDVEGQGSWMGISRQGRFAAVTNIRDPANHRIDAKSRGLLVSQFLQDSCSAIHYCEQLQAHSELYNGYNFVAFDGQSLVYQSSATQRPQSLSPGMYGISNAILDISWPKTRSAVKKLSRWLQCPVSVNQLAQLLNDRTVAADEVLPSTGVSLDLERVLSAEFIDLPEYGTRCSTGFLVRKSGEAEYCEISHDRESAESMQVLTDYLKG
jgi:uncharacterized protein with NRDE domain